ncbi:MAG: SdiA-regulated domain-containing protein [Deltaproteobacteria bacterium]|nr:SdiA-regulated domain-containing protein [Deltaproteobacteria bacterium]
MRRELWGSPRARVRAVIVAAIGVAAVAAPLVAEFGFSQSENDTAAWEIAGFQEPSGVVYDSSRNTLFVVGDEGDIGEVSVGGKLLRSSHLGGDFEGVTQDPSSHMLYVVREGHELIYEVRPEDFSITRRFTIDRTFEGDPNYLQRGGDGIEGITFVPDQGSKEGGRFFAVNQYDPPALLELAVPIRSSTAKFATATVVSARPVEAAPLSDVVWDSAINGFLIPSALWRKAYVTDSTGQYLRAVRLPALMPEGIALLPGGKFVIAQDSGGLVSWTPPVDPFVAGPASAAVPGPAVRPPPAPPVSEPDTGKP